MQVAVEEMFKDNNEILERIWAESACKEATLKVNEGEQLTDDFGEELGACQDKDKDKEVVDEKVATGVSEEVANSDRQNFLSQFHVIALSVLAGNYMEVS